MKTRDEFHAEAAYGYETLKKQCLDRVVRWVHGSKCLYAFEPMFFERSQFKRGRQVASPEEAKISYGLDANGQVAYSKEIMEADTGTIHEELHIREGQSAFLARYYSTKTFPPYLQTTQQLVLGADENPIRFNSEGRVLEYKWHDGKLIRVDDISGKHGPHHEELIYDEFGQLDEVWGVWGDERALRFRRAKKGVNIKGVESKIRELLIHAIQRTISKAKIEETAFCVALAYDGEGNDVLPPCIGIGLECERQRWVKEHGKDAKDFIWNPAEFTHYEKDHTQLEDEELDKACELLNGLLRPKENYAPAIKLLNSVAAELGKLDWKGKLKTTPDFVVYAVDFELGDLKRNLKLSVPPAKLEMLKKAKLL